MPDKITDIEKECFKMLLNKVLNDEEGYTFLKECFSSTDIVIRKIYVK